MKIYHLTDNASRFYETKGFFMPSGAGWKGPWSDRHLSVQEQYGVGICIRQPHPTKSRNPMHVEGWLQTADRKKLWHDGFIDTFNRFERTVGIPPIFYVGHPGGDKQDWSDRPDVTGRPYSSPPLLDIEAGFGVNRYMDAFNRTLSPYLRAGNHKSWIYFDGSANLVKGSSAFKMVDMIRTLMQKDDRVCGLESPPNLSSDPHLKPFSVAATYGSFVNRLQHNENNPWSGYTEPRLVFVTSNLPDNFVSKGTLGGWSHEMHQEMANRVIKVVRNGGIATLNLLTLQRAGYSTINSWFKEYGHDSL